MININCLTFVYQEKTLELDSNMTLGELLQLDNKKKKNKKYEIIVQDRLIPIKYFYSGKESYITITEEEKIENLLKRIAKDINKDFNDIFFLFNGERISEDKSNSTFYNFVIGKEKEISTIYILVCDSDKFIIKYSNWEKEGYISLTEEEKMEDVLKNIAKNINKDLNNIFFFI